ncbi:uncharacterized protein LOC112344683 [Selaginella moellendorffii]|uniref:uncharacterized protein LOC112344683 n=1 Tax=Selaginella moellendorffii TaxID=88036 RepID=UPI000D1D10E5|nr:uncharacterized protein LOC112344683 [Selaginella moellendorffii]|eukprot:XP_024525714.1 uncharacterized protein LOC112344683 [Selaginella moellendorffii]
MVAGVKRSWISDKEMDEFDHITGDQIRGMTDLRKLKKLERYMREEGFPQTAEAAYETIIKLGGRVFRPGERETRVDEYDEDFDGFLKTFDSWKVNSCVQKSAGDFSSSYFFTLLTTRTRSKVPMTSFASFRE